jgi:hypothetical protein
MPWMLSVWFEDTSSNYHVKQTKEELYTAIGQAIDLGIVKIIIRECDKNGNPTSRTGYVIHSADMLENPKRRRTDKQWESDYSYQTKSSDVDRLADSETRYADEDSSNS